MALYCVTGPMGAGKTVYAVKKCRDGLEEGKFVITNFKLTPGWETIVARKNLFRRLIPGRWKKLAETWERRTYMVTDLAELKRIRLAGSGEGRGVVVIDEGHVFMNARAWKEDGRGDLVEWVSATRKLGLDIFIITQDLQSLDRQVRDRLTYHVHLRNLSQFRVMGIPIFPVNVFIAITQWHAAGKAIVRRESYMLGLTKKLFETDDLSAFTIDLDPADAIRLPLPPPAPPTTASVLASATAAAGGAARRHDALEESRTRLMDPDRYIRDDVAYQASDHVSTPAAEPEREVGSSISQPADKSGGSSVR
jgi:hypothetical protein